MDKEQVELLVAWLRTEAHHAHCVERFKKQDRFNEAADLIEALSRPTVTGDLVERVADIIESFMLGRVGHHVCVNAAKEVVAAIGSMSEGS